MAQAQPEYRQSEVISGGSDEVLRPGSNVAGYRILALIGRGSYGQVYAAEHATRGDRVALKLVEPTGRFAVETIARLLEQARAVEELQHENIVAMRELVSLWPKPCGVIVMELLRGQTLQQLIESSAPLPVARVVRIARQMASALDALHQRGMVHCDVKPANAMVLEDAPDGIDDRIKLIDFGALSKVFGERRPTDGAQSHARTGSCEPSWLAGTPAYMSPEQARGEVADARSDIYGLGVVLYEMLTGELPFSAQTVRGQLDAHQHGRPRAPRELLDERHRLPITLERLIMCCLEKDSHDRPASMTTVSRILALHEPRGASATDHHALARRARVGRPTPVTPEGETPGTDLEADAPADDAPRAPRERSRRRGSRRWLGWLLLGAVLALAAGIRQIL